MFGAKIGKRIVIRANMNISFPWRLQLGDHVWIGYRAIVMPGVTIGEGAVVAAGAGACGVHGCGGIRPALCSGPSCQT